MRILAAAIAIAVIGVGTSKVVHAKGSTDTATYTLDIPAQSLNDALQALALASRHRLIYSSVVVDGKNAPAVKGEFTAAEAVERLLAGTTLTYEVTADGLLVIRQKGPEGSRTSASTEAADDLHVARVNQSLSLEGQDQTETSGNTGASAGTPEGRLEEPQEIVVTGTYIRGAKPVGAPVRVYDREELARSGATTLEAFLTQRPEMANTVKTSAAPSSPATAVQNDFNGAAVDIHGLGAGATLTLVNGHRLAPSGSGSFSDISFLPLAAIERIEVLSDGASAVYGSDAVAGVVNFILRRDFSGAETALNLSYPTQGGARQAGASQLLGRSWNTGNVAASYSYRHDDPLVSGDRDFLASTGGGPSDVLPEQTTHSFFGTLQQRVFGSPVDVDVYYSKHTFSGNFSTLSSPALYDGETRQLGANIHVTRELRRGWSLDFLAAAARNDSQRTIDQPLFSFTSKLDEIDNLSQFDLRGSGPLFHLPAGAVRASLGASHRREERRSSVGLDRNVSSLFGEILLPFVAGRDDLLLHGLDMSVAARYDEYSDAGSSVSPRIGIRWSVRQGLDFRASYGESFRAPTLPQLDSTPLWFTFNAPNTASSTGTTNTLFNLGLGNPGLNPETSTSLTAGLDFEPRTLPGLRLAVTYFDIDYSDRIALPPVGPGGSTGVYSLLSTLEPFFDFSPVLSDVQSVFALGPPAFAGDFAGEGPEGVQAIFDFRPTNITADHQAGIDFSLSYDISADAARVTPFVDGSYLLKFERRVVSTTPMVELVGTLYNPTDLRLRGGLRYSRHAFNSALTLNYRSAYDNTGITPVERVPGWTTVDVYVAYDFADAGALLDGTRVSLSIDNILNKDPPRIFLGGGAITSGYDPANASPLGTVIALHLAKRW